MWKTKRQTAPENLNNSRKLISKARSKRTGEKVFALEMQMHHFHCNYKLQKRTEYSKCKRYRYFGIISFANFLSTHSISEIKIHQEFPPSRPFLTLQRTPKLLLPRQPKRRSYDYLKFCGFPNETRSNISMDKLQSYPPFLHRTYDNITCQLYY